MNHINMASTGCTERGSLRRIAEVSPEEMRKMLTGMYDRMITIEYLAKLAGHSARDDDLCTDRIEAGSMTVAALDAVVRYTSELSSEIAVFL